MLINKKYICVCNVYIKCIYILTPSNIVYKLVIMALLGDELEKKKRAEANTLHLYSALIGKIVASESPHHSGQLKQIRPAQHAPRRKLTIR